MTNICWFISLSAWIVFGKNSTLSIDRSNTRSSCGLSRFSFGESIRRSPAVYTEEEHEDERTSSICKSNECIGHCNRKTILDPRGQALQVMALRQAHPLAVNIFYPKSSTNTRRPSCHFL